MKKPFQFPCPKCGNTAICRNFKVKDEDIDLSFSDRHKERINEFISIKFMEAKVKKDCIMHHCTCCQFNWETEPLNNLTTKKVER